MRNIIVLFLVLVAQLWSVDAYCLEQETHNQAAQYLHQQEPKKAIDVINATNPAADDKDALFLLGMANANLGNHETAIDYYNRLLALDKSPRARLELANSYLALGDYSSAKQEFESVLGRAIPEQVKQNVKEQLAYIAAQKNWTLGLALGWVYDSNINAAPYDSSIMAFGLPFTLTDASLAKGSQGQKAELSYSYTLNRVGFADSLALQLFGSHLDYEKGSEYDSDTALAALTPSWTTGNHTIRTGLRYTRSWLGGLGDRESFGVAPEWYYKLGPQVFASVKGTLEHVNDLTSGGQEYGWTYWLRPGLQYYIDQKTMLDFGLVRSEDHFRHSYDSSERNGAEIALTRALPYDVTLYLRPSIDLVRYMGTDPVDTEIREDTRYSVFCSLAKDMPIFGQNVTPSIEVTYTDNDSDIKRFDYERTKVALMLRALF